jgi:hypothetical protein
LQCGRIYGIKSERYEHDDGLGTDSQHTLHALALVAYLELICALF